ncbi:MAG: PorP/SprF family type IX secretion system membrane protein [Bacteroidales bacterium]|jgi:type IX secretion system PorP/SprF family membrane protein|nr:PorP/SprF family type IX secretion system membrane protein [Bacteroidales bacterium]
MKKIYKFTPLIISLFFFVNAFAQDPNFSQFYLKEMYYNPAFIGINPGLRGTVTDRHLWTNVPGEWGTQSIAVDFYDQKFAEGGLGLIVTRNSQGENFINTFTGGVGYAKQIRFTPDFLMQIGGQVTYIQKSLDYTALTFVDEFDPRFGRIYETEFLPPVDGKFNVGKFDFSAGLVGRFNIRKNPVRYIASNTIGVAFHHLSQPDMSWLGNNEDSRLPMKVDIHATSSIRIDRKGYYNKFFLLTPGFLYENQTPTSVWFDNTDAGFQTISFGLNSVIPTKLSFMSSLQAGLWVRKMYTKRESIGDVYSSLKNKTFDSMIFTLGYTKYSRDNKRSYQLVYSYDMTISQAGLGTGGTHEITLSFEIHDLALPSSKRRPAAIPHPNDRFSRY